MCDIWNNPTKEGEEITAKELEMLPAFKFVNITGGEPFLRKDLEEIIAVMFQKSPRVVILTSGWHTDKILALAKKYPNIGIRVSIEGLLPGAALATAITTALWNSVLIFYVIKNLNINPTILTLRTSE